LYTAPQLIIQIGLAITQPLRYRVLPNDDESRGSAQCSSGQAGWLTLQTLGYSCFCTLVLILLLTAHQTRILPSLFNETRVIFDSTLATLVIVILGMGILAVANGPETSPAVSYLLGITLTLSSTLNTSLRIMMPKLRMIWRGETVLVSKLVSDHKQAVLKDDMLYKQKRRSSATEFAIEGTTFGHGEQSMYNASTSSTNGVMYEDFLGNDFASMPHLVIQQSEAPAKWLVLKLIDLQGKLSRVNDRIMSGSVVPGAEWEGLRNASHRLSTTFRRKVRFGWEVQQPEESASIVFSEQAARSLDLGPRESRTSNSRRHVSSAMTRSEASSIFARSTRSTRSTSDSMPIILDDDDPDAADDETDTERAGNQSQQFDEDEELYPIQEVRFKLPDED
jgi:hypothetical protein